METVKLVIFKLKNEEYGIDVNHVISIEKPTGIKPIPRLPHYIKGVTKVREQLIPVVDLHWVFYDSEGEMTDSSRLVVLKTNQLNLALLVSEAKELLDVERDSIKQLGLAAYEKTAYFPGVVNFDDRLITLVKPDELIKGLDGLKEIEEYMREQEEMQEDPL